MMMDVLSGILSGSCFGTDVVGPYVTERRSGVGHLAIALNIDSFWPLADFCSDMGRLIDNIKNAPSAPGTHEVFYPGELEARTDDHHGLVGIALPQGAIDELNTEAKAPGISELNASSH